MEHASADEIILRLKQAAKVTKDADLAKLLGLSKQSISVARSRGKVPDSWIPKAAQLFNVRIEWLYYGDEKQNVSKATTNNEISASDHSYNLQNVVFHADPTAICRDCSRIKSLERELEAMKTALAAQQKTIETYEKMLKISQQKRDPE